MNEDIRHDEFQESVFNYNDLAAILRASAHFDFLLSSMILKRLPDAVHFFGDNTPFSKKIVFAIRLEIIDENTRRALVAFNALRNSFAHELEKRILTPEDDSAMIKVLPPQALDIITEMNQGVWPDFSTYGRGDVTKTALMALHKHLLNLRENIGK